MSLVWERAPYSGGSLLVLLALADWANDDGLCWPSIQRLADKTRIDRRSAQRIIRQLEKDGFIKIDEGGGRAKQHRYFIQLETVTKCRPFPEQASAETATFETQRATSDAETATRTSPDPLVEPLDDPSVFTRYARKKDAIRCISTLMKARDAGINILPWIESVENDSFRRTLLEWAA